MVKFIKTARRPGKKKIMQDIAAVEKLLNRELPEDLKNFIVEAAGTRPEPDCFPIQNFPDNPYNDCYGFCGGTDISLVVTVNALQGRMPDGFFPIGDTGDGGMICYALEGENAGSIWYWDHETESTITDVDGSNCYLCAGSLAEFINSFFEVDEDDEDDEDSNSRIRDKKLANEALAEVLAEQWKREVTVKEVREWIQEQNGVWHHHKGGIMQVVDKKTHLLTEHTGFFAR